MQDKLIIVQVKQKDQMIQQEAMKGTHQRTEEQRKLIIQILKSLKGIERALQGLIKS